MLFAKTVHFREDRVLHERLRFSQWHFSCSFAPVFCADRECLLSDRMLGCRETQEKRMFVEERTYWLKRNRCRMCPRSQKAPIALYAKRKCSFMLQPHAKSNNNTVVCRSSVDCFPAAELPADERRAMSMRHILDAFYRVIASSPARLPVRSFDDALASVADVSLPVRMGAGDMTFLEAAIRYGHADFLRAVLKRWPSNQPFPLINTRDGAAHGVRQCCVTAPRTRLDSLLMVQVCFSVLFFLHILLLFVSGGHWPKQTSTNRHVFVPAHVFLVCLCAHLCSCVS